MDINKKEDENAIYISDNDPDVYTADSEDTTTPPTHQSSLDNWVNYINDPSKLATPTTTTASTTPTTSSHSNRKRKRRLPSECCICIQVACRL